MPDSTDLLHQLFHQHGLVGLIIGFLILGPGFTFVRVRSVRARLEAQTQALLNDFARHESQRADRLEADLSAALTQLEAAEQEIARLQREVAENEECLQEVGRLQQQGETLTRRIGELEQLTVLKDEELSQRDRRISQLEHRLHDHPAESIEEESL